MLDTLKDKRKIMDKMISLKEGIQVLATAHIKELLKKLDNLPQSEAIDHKAKSIDFCANYLTEQILMCLQKISTEYQGFLEQENKRITKRYEECLGDINNFIDKNKALKRARTFYKDRMTEVNRLINEYNLPEPYLTILSNVLANGMIENKPGEYDYLKKYKV